MRISDNLIDKIYYALVSIAILVVIFRLIDLSKLTYIFPADPFQDFASHYARTYFYIQYGYNGFVPNWYGGFNLFDLYPPLLYIITSSISIFTGIYNSIYISLITITLTLIVLTTLALRYVNVRSYLLVISTVALTPVFYQFYFTSGRMAEMLSLSLILPVVIVVYYKESLRAIERLVIGTLLGLSIISHPILFALFIPMIALEKIVSRKKLLSLFKVVCIGLLISSFWVLPFITNSLSSNDFSNNASLKQYYEIKTTYIDDWGYVIFLGIISAVLLIKYKEKTSVPNMVIILLLLSSILTFIPLYNQILLAIFTIPMTLFIGMSLTQINPKIAKIIAIMLLSIFLLTIIVKPKFTQYNDYFLSEEFNELNNTTQEIPNNSNVIFLNSNYQESLYSYYAIDKNLSTPLGWYFQIEPRSIREKVNELEVAVQNKDCNKAKEYKNLLGLDYIFFNNTIYDCN